METKTAPLAEKLIDEIIVRRTAELSKKIEVYPRRNPILSDLPDCDRQIVYGVTNWQDKEKFTPDLIARFAVGNLQEREIVRELEGLGFRVILSQMPVEIKGKGGVLLATGRIDGKIEFEGQKIPFEIKSANPNIFDQVKCIEDFQKKPWLRKYVRQLMLYLYGNNAEQGIFIMTNCLGAWKMFVLNLDYGECEHLLQRLEHATEHIKAKTLPDRITYDPSVCDKCPFAVLCLQDINNKPAEFVSDEAFIDAVKRHEELAPSVSEHKELHDRIKGVMEKTDKLIAGDYLIQNLNSQTTKYEIPEDVKKQYAVKVPQKRMKILLLERK